jgi:hypothetical protein
MLRAVREIAPGYIVAENVYGLVNWKGGMVFNEVQADLEAEGYEVAPVILPACSVNAPHRRDRVWFVAYSANTRIKGERQKRKDSIHGLENVTNTENFRLQKSGDSRQRGARFENSYSNGENATYSKRIGQQGSGLTQKSLRTKAEKDWKASWSYDDGRWPTQSPVCSGNDGLPPGMDGFTVSTWREECIKAYGNAIVPQVAFEIFKCISVLSGAEKKIINTMLSDELSDEKPKSGQVHELAYWQSVAVGLCVWSDSAAPKRGQTEEQLPCPKVYWAGRHCCQWPSIGEVFGLPNIHEPHGFAAFGLGGWFAWAGN